MSDLLARTLAEIRQASETCGLLHVMPLVSPQDQDQPMSGGAVHGITIVCQPHPENHSLDPC